jgi:hypothetical protein
MLKLFDWRLQPPKGKERNGRGISVIYLSWYTLSDCPSSSSDLPRKWTSQRKENTYCFLLSADMVDSHWPAGFSLPTWQRSFIGAATFSREAKACGPPDLGSLHACMADDGWLMREEITRAQYFFYFIFPFVYWKFIFEVFWVLIHILRLIKKVLEDIV